MDYHRARDIIESHGVVSVVYKDVPVWIEQIHMDHETAEITNLYNNERLEVPLEELSAD